MTDLPEPPISTKASRPFPGLWPSIGWVILFFALQILVSGVTFVIAMAIDKSGRGFAELSADLTFVALPTIWGLALASLTMLGLLWLYLRKDGRVAAIKLDRWSQISLGKTVGLAALAIGAGIAFNHGYATYVIPDIKVQEMLRQLFAAIPDTAANYALLFTVIAIIAPILEELLFRGLLQNSLANRLPVWAAILIASMVFGAAHLDFAAFPPLMAMGIAFGYLYHRTGSLRVNIAMHVVNNAAAMLLT
ncbi:MAG: CPBP family intramembrane glutamic endopeptidase [Sphingorhabdus sp.]